jgi:hypothetical protein
VLELNWYVLHVQGEMDANGGQPETGPVVVVGGVLGVVGTVEVVCCVVVVEELQLVKPNGLSILKEVPLEQVPPGTPISSWGLSRMSHAKSQRLAMQLIGS